MDVRHIGYIGALAFSLAACAGTTIPSSLPSGVPSALPSLLPGGSATPSQATASVSGSATPSAAASPFDPAAAEEYCTDQGGVLVERLPTWNTNSDPSAWLIMGAPMTFCEFETTGDGSRISVDLVTLYSENPTLAAIAYLSKVPVTLPPEPSANPAEYNCRVGLEGSSDFGNSGASGGGWTNQAEPVFVVMNECVFADMSAIDEFGIFYYANGDVRGADLATRMRYQPGDQLPAIYAPPPR